MPKNCFLAFFLVLFCAISPCSANAQEPLAEIAEKDIDISLLAENIIQGAAQSANLLEKHGSPAWMVEAKKANASVLVEFPRGPLPDLAAAEFALIACSRFVQSSVEMETPARHIDVTVTSPLPDGRVRVYGTAIYDGKMTTMKWEKSGINMDAASAPKIPPQNKSAAQKPMLKPAAPKTPPRQAGSAVPGPQAIPGQPAEEFFEEELVVEGNAPRPRQKIDTRMPEKRKVIEYPQLLRPGAMGPKAAPPPLPGGCPGAAPFPPQGKMPGGKMQPESLPGGESLPSDSRPGKNVPSVMQARPILADNSMLVQALLNETAVLANLQETFGNPSFTILGDPGQTNLLVQFGKGPLPPNAAMEYGMLACDILVRSSVSGDLPLGSLTITVCSLLPGGGLQIYGTAIFNGSLDAIAWEAANLQIPAGEARLNPAQEPQPGRRPLNVRPGMITPGIHPAEKESRLMNRAERQQARQKGREGQDGKRLPQTGIPHEPEKNAERQFQPTVREQALDNANGANQASYSHPVKPIVNAIARSLGLQSNYDLPESLVIGGNQEAQILLLFKRGPMPDASAASFGLMACEQLARAYIVKGLGIKKLSVTIAYDMEDGRRYDYGTAIFNGNLDDLAWVVTDHII